MSKARPQSANRRAIRQNDGVQNKGTNSTKSGTGNGQKADHAIKAGGVRNGFSNTTIKPRRKSIGKRKPKQEVIVKRSLTTISE